MINAMAGLRPAWERKNRRGYFVSQAMILGRVENIGATVTFLLSVALLKYCGIRAIRHGVFSAVTIFL